MGILCDLTLKQSTRAAALHVHTRAVVFFWHQAASHRRPSKFLQRRTSCAGSLKDMLAGAPAADADHEAAPAPAPQEPGDLEC